MPLGVQLLNLRRDLRSETGMSLNPAQGVQAQASFDLILARQQRELWDAYNWQHLQMWVDMPLASGQSTYDYPVEMGFDQIRKMFVAMGSSGSWQPLGYGIRSSMIGPAGAGVGTPTRWRNVIEVDTSGPQPITNPIGQFNLVPTPGSDGMVLRIEGLAPLSPLIADSDSCIIDSTAIVLFAAAELLAIQKSEGAPIKLQKAQNYLRRLLADQGADKSGNWNMGGSQRYGVDPDRGGRAVPYIDYIP